jgi:hypothetical protein
MAGNQASAREGDFMATLEEKCERKHCSLPLMATQGSPVDFMKNFATNFFPAPDPDPCRAVTQCAIFMPSL